MEIDPQGRIAIHGDHVEMGNGIGTALANRVAAYLGGVADEVTVHDVDAYGPLALVTSGNSYTMDQATQDAAAKNPRWVPAISTATVASNGAHVGTQAAAEAARVIFRFGLWPAALELWGIAPTDPTAKQWEAARWKDGHLLMPGLAPLSLPAIAAKAHARNGVTGAMAHAFSRWGWSRATFPIAGQTWTADIDALAVRKGGGKFARLDRTEREISAHRQQPFRHRLTRRMCGTLGPRRDRARHRRTAHRQGLQRPRMRQGAGAGNRSWAGARRLRHGRRLRLARDRCRLTKTGPATGNGISDNTSIARGSDLPLHDLEIEVLPPVTPDEPPKGMAEVVMIPVVPALLNAIFDATGRRFQSLPVTQSMLKGALA